MRVFVAQAVSTALLDLIVFAIPIQLCFKPETPKRARRSLQGLLVLGFL